MVASQQAVLGNPDVARYVGAMPHAETVNLVGELLSRPGPAPRGTRRVAELLRKKTVFDSREDLAREIGDMQPCVLDAILLRLVAENKVIVDHHGSLVWIHAPDNKKMLACLRSSVPLPPGPGRPHLP